MKTPLGNNLDQLISTLQDVYAGRRTLNQNYARAIIAELKRLKKEDAMRTQAEQTALRLEWGVQ